MDNELQVVVVVLNTEWLGAILEPICAHAFSLGRGLDGWPRAWAAAGWLSAGPEEFAAVLAEAGGSVALKDGRAVAVILLLDGERPSMLASLPKYGLRPNEVCPARYVEGWGW